MAVICVSNTRKSIGLGGKWAVTINHGKNIGRN